MSEENKKEEQKASQLLTLRGFLENTPPGAVSTVRAGSGHGLYGAFILVMPEIELFCGAKSCEGLRLHKVSDKDRTITSGALRFAVYRCKNCGNVTKTYALSFGIYEDNQTDINVGKIGESPQFSHRVPSRVIRLVQPHAELFRKAVRAEDLGFGIGAFAYYRQIVEGQRNHLLTEIKKVAGRLGTPADVLAEYDAAIAENQFAKSIGLIKHGLPQSLLINGHNPLLLLHNALSEGIHAGTDEECLELATSIRVILTELANRISEALKDEAEVRNAIHRLTQKKSNP